MIFNTLKSKNYSKKKRNPSKIKFLIIHYTGMQSKRVSIKKLTNFKGNNRVSCHYFIDRKGETTNMVEDNRVAWHAGKSRWKNFENLNGHSIGIELENKGHEFGYEEFTKKQINKLIKLCLNLKKKYKIKNSYILGHSDISPLRKKDPGEKFPWKLLEKKGVGNWYSKLNNSKKNIQKNMSRKIFFENLYKIGYRYFSKNISSKKNILITRAFQSRYNQNKVDGLIDQKTYEISHYLASKVKN
jgi:N-acetylmuramoyl-L-alanine amidase